MSGNASFRPRNTTVLSVCAVDAPIVMTSAAFDERLADTYRRVGTRAGLLEKLAGVVERRWWPTDVSFADAAAMAAAKALAEAGITPAQVGVMINTAVSREYLEPSTAVAIHHQVGLPTNCLNFDLANACLGFVNGIQLAGTMIDSGQADYAVIVDAEGTRYTQELTLARLARDDATAADLRSQFATLTLGSGSAAMVLGRADRHPEGHRVIGGVSRAGTEHHDLCVGDLTRMRTDIKRLFDAGLALALATWADAKEEFDWDGIDWFVAHQTSVVHIRAMAKALGVDPARFPLTLPMYGNMGPAAVPFTLARHMDQVRARPDSVAGHRVRAEHLVRRNRLVINKLVASPGVVADLRDMPGIDPAWSRLAHTVDAEGVLRTWHVLDNGVVPQAGTLLCVHGNPTWSYLWRRFLAYADPGWRVVAVDQLGMGYSERPRSPRLLAARIDDLDAMTSELEITGPVVVAAHDWGGPISLGWAQRHLDQIAGLILTNTGVAVPQTDTPALIRLARSRLLRELVCVRTETFVRAAGVLSWPAIPAEVRTALRAPYSDSGRRRAIGDFVADIPLEPNHPSRAALDRVALGLADFATVPTLLLWGPKDPVFRQTSLRDLERRLPHADVHRYAGASHLVVEDAPRLAEDAWLWIRSNATTRPPESVPEKPTRRPTADLVIRIAADPRAGSDSRPAIAELGRGGTRVTSFAELERRVEALADGLRHVGVRPGHRIAVLVPPGLDLTATIYASWRVGAAIVVADAGLGWRQMADALRSADPDYLIGIPPATAAAAAFKLPGIRLVAGELPRPIRRLLGVEHATDELAARGDRGSAPFDAGRAQVDTNGASSGEAAVLFTSGATGPPKGVVYGHHQLRAQLDLLRSVCNITPSDRLVAAFAPFALYGPALGIGAAVPQMDVTKPGTLTAARLAEAAAAIEATLIFASPAALRNVVATAGELTAEQSSALARIRLVLSAGAPVSIPLLRRLTDVLPHAELHTPYGMTEALPLTDISLPELEEAGSGNGVCVGRPLPGVRLRISPLDSLGRATGPLTDQIEITGEICVSAAHVKHRYDRLWATERASSRDTGWHRTGDVGHLDAAGRLWVEGRLVHVITTADGPLTPVGVEQRIEAESPVTGAALVGVGPPGTQQAVAVVVPKVAGSVGLAERELAGSVRAAAGIRLAAVLAVGALPVDIRHAAKIDRQRLARWAGRVLAGARVGRP